MPILLNNPPSVSINGSILDEDKEWWIAKVKSRQEKKFAFDLIEDGVEYYLPYYERVSKNKKVKSLNPLFPSYVPFVCADSPFKFLENRCVSTILSVSQQDKFRKELYQVYVANSNGYNLGPYNSECKIGDSVKVVCGPLKGLCGSVLLIGNNNKVMLKIDSLGRISLDISVSQLEIKGR